MATAIYCVHPDLGVWLQRNPSNVAQCNPGLLASSHLPAVGTKSKLPEHICESQKLRVATLCLDSLLECSVLFTTSSKYGTALQKQVLGLKCWQSCLAPRAFTHYSNWWLYVADLSTIHTQQLFSLLHTILDTIHLRVKLSSHIREPPLLPHRHNC
jgi:hypothetical protein